MKKLYSPIPAGYKISLTQDFKIKTLRMISEKLYEKKLMRRKDDFADVILLQSKKLWTGTIEEWVYLFYKFFNNSPAILKTHDETLGYLQVSKEFFYYQESLQSRFEKLNLSKLLYNVKKRSTKKYVNPRKVLDKIIEESIINDPIADIAD